MILLHIWNYAQLLALIAIYCHTYILYIHVVYDNNDTCNIRRPVPASFWNTKMKMLVLWCVVVSQPGEITNNLFRVRP